MKFIAKTLKGLEHILEKELLELGAKKTKVLNRAVQVECNLPELYKMHLHSRIALRFIKPMFAFEADNEEEFYKKTVEIKWNKVFSVDRTFKIQPVVFSEKFTHSHFIGLKLKDAICDHFRKKFGKRPSVNAKNPDYLFVLNIRDNQVEISLDATGDSLHKRGYRLEHNEAPLNEILAAGMLTLSEWDTSKPFVDGMTGSGTLVCEALMMANNVPPGFQRKQFAFMHWDDFHNPTWVKLKREAKENIKQDYPNITGVEISNKNFKIAKDNLVRARFMPIHHLQLGDFFNYIPKEKEGVVMLNPPYDERMEMEDIEAFYKQIGDHLKQNFQGWTAWIISANRDALKHIGLRTSKRIDLINGKLPCKFVCFELY